MKSTNDRRRVAVPEGGSAARASRGARGFPVKLAAVGMLLVAAPIVVLAALLVQPGSPGPTAERRAAGNLVITEIGAASGKAYVAAENLANGSPAFIDRNDVYSNVPGEFVGADFIRTADDDGSSTVSSLLTFRVDRDATVWVAHDDRHGTKPGWLGSFADSGADVTVDTVTHSLFRKDYPAGVIALGGNIAPGTTSNAHIYTVILTARNGGGSGTAPSAPTLWIKP